MAAGNSGRRAAAPTPALPPQRLPMPRSATTRPSHGHHPPPTVPPPRPREGPLESTAFISCARRPMDARPRRLQPKPRGHAGHQNAVACHPPAGAQTSPFLRPAPPACAPATDPAGSGRSRACPPPPAPCRARSRKGARRRPGCATPSEALHAPPRASSTAAGPQRHAAAPPSALRRRPSKTPRAAATRAGGEGTPPPPAPNGLRPTVRTGGGEGGRRREGVPGRRRPRVSPRSPAGTTPKAHYSVCGTARDPGDAKNAHLKVLEGADERLQLVMADLLDYNSVASAIAGCEGVFHVACPVPSGRSTDPEAEIIAPAVTGTLNVLKACYEAKVKRVVMVSSGAAVVANPHWPKGKAFDEESWSDEDYCRKNGDWYYLSKTLVEREAFAYAAKTGLDIVTICPSLVIGPLMQSTVNTSSKVLLNYLKGEHDTVENKSRDIVDVPCS